MTCATLILQPSTLLSHCRKVHNGHAYGAVRLMMPPEQRATIFADCAERWESGAWTWVQHQSPVSDTEHDARGALLHVSPCNLFALEDDLCLNLWHDPQAPGRTCSNGKCLSCWNDARERTLADVVHLFRETALRILTTVAP